jgi:WhiB family transcriptional regulator, redox-sensing transcriptional regulator
VTVVVAIPCVSIGPSHARNPGGAELRKTYRRHRKRESDPVVERMRAGWTWGWQFDGACRGEDSSLFFAPSYFEKREEKAAREVKAKAICSGCPVREPCLEYALRVREPHGIWGGLNEYERRQRLRQQALQAG